MLEIWDVHACLLPNASEVKLYYFTQTGGLCGDRQMVCVVTGGLCGLHEDCMKMSVARWR